MHKQERHRLILARLKERETLGLEEAMQLFDASSATIRRDFADLLERGLATREPNALRRLDVDAGVDRPFLLREMEFAREKDAIAQKAVSLLRENDIIFLDGGTTTQRLAAHLRGSGLRVITTCVRIAGLLADRQYDSSDMEVVLPGGTLSPRSYVVYGPQTRRAVEGYRANWAFIGVDGIDETHLFSVNEFMSETQSAMIRNSDRAVLLGDHSKFHRHSMVRTARLDERCIVITDEWPDNGPTIEAIRRSGAQVLAVKVE